MSSETANPIFEGIFPGTCDIRNRVIVPDAFRELLGREVIMVATPGEAVKVYPASARESLVQAARADPNNPLALLALSLAATTVDSQNRLLIPAPLLVWLGESSSDDKVVIVGGIGCFTIMLLSTWRRYAIKLGYGASAAAGVSG